MDWFASQKKPLSEFDWSVMVTMLPVGGMIGALSAGPIIKKLGPHRTQMCTDVMYIAGGLCLALAQNLAVLCIGRTVVCADLRMKYSK